MWLCVAVGVCVLLSCWATPIYYLFVFPFFVNFFSFFLGFVFVKCASLLIPSNCGSARLPACLPV